MAKHSRNNVENSVFTYMERLGLKEDNIWGDVKERLSQDNQKSFEQCSICLSFAINPVCCPKGSIFCQQCLLENFFFQKAETKKLLKKYEEQEKEKEQKKQYINKDKNNDDNMIKAFEIYHENKNHDLKKCFLDLGAFSSYCKTNKKTKKCIILPRL